MKSVCPTWENAVGMRGGGRHRSNGVAKIQERRSGNLKRGIADSKGRHVRKTIGKGYLPTRDIVCPCINTTGEKERKVSIEK